MKRILSILSVLLFFFLYTKSSNPFIRSLDKQVYRAANKNWDIQEDSLGFIYIANDKGLLEFDGMQWSLQEVPNKLGIKSIYVESHNVIYTGGFEDFGRWTRNAFGKLTYTSLSSSIGQNNIHNNEFWQIHKKGDYIYFQSFQTIYALKDNIVFKVSSSPGFLFLLKIKDELWVQKMKGTLFKIDNGKLEPLQGTDMLKGTDVRVILPYEKETFLIGTSNSGLYVYDKKKITQWHAPISEKMKEKELNCAILIENGNYLFGTITNGIYESNPKGEIVRHYSTKNQLINNTILSLLKSRNNSVWVGTEGGIANIQYYDNITYYAFEQNTLGAIYDAIFWKDQIFFCANQGVYYTLKPELNKTQLLSDMKFVEGTQGQAWTFSNINGELYCAHNRGIKKIQPDFKSVPFLLTDKGVFNLSEEKLYNKNILFASTYSTLSLLSPDGKIRNIGASDTPVQYAMTDHLNNIWIKVPHKGIYKYRISPDFKQVKDSLYLGTDTNPTLSQNLNMFKLGGRIIISGDSIFYTFDEIDGKLKENKIINNCFHPTSEIQNIKQAKENLYWIMTASSIHLLYYDGYTAKLIDQYALDPFSLSLVEHFQNISILNDSLNLVCLENGFLIYNHNKKRKEQKPGIPQILTLSSSDINGKSQTYSLSSSANAVQITANQSYSLQINLYNPNAFYQNESFQYKLQGIDKTWSEPLHDNTIHFKRIPQGNYVLEIRTINSLNETSEAITVFLEILAPFYKTKQAFGVYLLLFCAILYLIWTLILRKYRNIHLRKIRAREKERLKQLNAQLEEKVLKINSELFTQQNLILQKRKLFREIKEILDNFYEKKENKNINQLYRSLSNILNTELNEEDNWEMILLSFEQKHPTFFLNLKKISPDFTPNDLRLCMCLRLNFDSKKIADLMNLSVRTIDNNRSKLRKKLNLSHDANLTEFLLEL